MKKSIGEDLKQTTRDERISSPDDSSAVPGAENHRQAVVQFFNHRCAWWSRVYDEGLPKGFFSYEMSRRREMVGEAVDDYCRTRPAMKILEVGCGPGGLLKRLPSSVHQVVGTDINPNYLSAMRNACPQATGICCDLEAMPFPNSMFDVVVCVGVLSYLSRDDLAIAEMARLLKPGGVLVVSNPCYYMLDRILDPYYLIVWPMRQAYRFASRSFRTSPAPVSEFSSCNVRRYRFQQLTPLYRRHGLHKLLDRPVSFGPLRFWKKERLSVSRAIRLSEFLVGLAERRSGRFLQRLANHRVVCLQKAATKEGTS